MSVSGQGMDEVFRQEGPRNVHVLYGVGVWHKE